MVPPDAGPRTESVIKVFCDLFEKGRIYRGVRMVNWDPAAAAFIVKTTQYFVPMAGKIDVEAEIGKLTESLAYYEGFLASVMKKLSNERFVQSAPEKVVMNERAKQADAEAKIAAIREQLAALK